MLLTNDAGIQALSQRYFSKNEVTDVISLAFTPLPGEDSRPSAEIAINLERALNLGARLKSATPSSELALYVAHGCNHLSGADDKTPQERLHMRRQEHRWLRHAARLGLTRGLLE